MAKKAFPYKTAWESLAPHVSFRFNPAKQPKTAAGRKRYGIEKQRVRRYFTAFQLLAGSRSVVEYRGHSTRNLRAAQLYAQHPKGFNRFTTAFVPAPPASTVEVRRGRVIVRSDHVARVVWQFADFERFTGERLQDPAAIAARILKRDTLSKSFVAVAGEHETKSWIGRQGLVHLIAYHSQNYDNQHRWFTGVIGYRYDTQSDARAYRAARGLSKKSRRARRRALLKHDPIRANER